MLNPLTNTCFETMGNTRLPNGRQSLWVVISTWLQKNYAIQGLQQRAYKATCTKLCRLKNCKSQYVYQHGLKRLFTHDLPPLLINIMGGGVFLLRMGEGGWEAHFHYMYFIINFSTVPVVVKPGGITRDYDMMCLFCQVFIMRFTVWHDEWFFEQSIFSLAGWRRGWCWLLCTVLWLVLWAR